MCITHNVEVCFIYSSYGGRVRSRDEDSSDFQQQRLATKKVLSLFLKLREYKPSGRVGGRGGGIVAMVTGIVVAPLWRQ